MTSLFKSPKAPSFNLAAVEPPAPPPPTPLPDPGDVLLKARKRKASAQRTATSGRLSTILSDGETLG